MSRVTLRALARALTPFLLVVGLTLGLSPQAVAAPSTVEQSSGQAAESTRTSAEAKAKAKQRARKEARRARKELKKRRKAIRKERNSPEKRLERRLDGALKAAASRAGKPYRYGATGPNAFDCSGLTRWAYQRVGKNLPRTSGAQAAATRRISRQNARPGDLVFFHNGGRVYHVGIYAGGNHLWHAPRPGQRVHKARIWTGAVFFGRVR